MSSPARRRRAWPRLALGLTLAGCGTAAPPPPCPLAAIVQGADRLDDYQRPDRPAPEDLRHIALLSDLASGCRYQDGALEVALTFNLIAEQGPAHTGEPVRLGYFVALVADDRVLDKQTFTTELVFTPGHRRTGVTQEVVLRYPRVDPARGAGHRIYVGFELDRAALNRRLGPTAR